MQATFRQAMGNCVACREPSSDAETPTSPTTILDSQDCKDGPVAAVRSSQHGLSLAGTEIAINGNSRTGQLIETGGSLHREKSFRVLYSRIQPLSRSNDSKQKEVSESKLNALFEIYRDPDAPDFILAEGMERLLDDLNLSPDELKVLIFAWKLDAEHMCQFSRQEFVTGLRSMRADSLATLNVRLSEIYQEVLRNPSLFKDLYRFTFRFGLEVGQRGLPTEMAISLWRIVFSAKSSPLLERWLDYLAKHPVNGIPRDTWNMFLYLTEQLGDDLSLYDDSHAWPSLFDDFVEHENDRVNQNVAKVKTGVIEDYV